MCVYIPTSWKQWFFCCDFFYGQLITIMVMTLWRIEYMEVCNKCNESYNGRIYYYMYVPLMSQFMLHFVNHCFCKPLADDCRSYNVLLCCNKEVVHQIKGLFLSFYFWFQYILFDVRAVSCVMLPVLIWITQLAEKWCKLYNGANLSIFSQPM